MNRKDLQSLSRLRLREAKALLAAGFNGGAYYLAGYSIECALKACIAKQTRRHDFPEKTVTELFTHVPQILLKKARLDGELKNRAGLDLVFRANWGIVLEWSVESRYNVRSREDAALLLAAIGDRDMA